MNPHDDRLSDMLRDVNDPPHFDRDRAWAGLQRRRARRRAWRFRALAFVPLAAAAALLIYISGRRAPQTLSAPVAAEAVVETDRAVAELEQWLRPRIDSLPPAVRRQLAADLAAVDEALDDLSRFHASSPDAEQLRREHVAHVLSSRARLLHAAAGPPAS